MKPNRLAESARTAAATGAYRAVLSVPAAVLRTLPAYEKAPHGLSDLLSVAADCTERCGGVGAGPIAGLSTLAARPIVAVRHAVRLQAAWGQGAGATAVDIVP
ncbi:MULTISPECIES: hypothetical protein [unclassified Streptomyces]|uniref:hypothetical protein n=1 Tax=unclassified Streptomyces TaxID=2593676 RepID=UPI0033ACED30